VNLYEVPCADVPSEVAADVLRDAGFELRFAYVGDDPIARVLVVGTEITLLCAEAVMSDFAVTTNTAI